MDQIEQVLTPPRPPKKKQVQPKTHAGKSRLISKFRDKKIIMDIIAGKTQTQAGIDAGLSPKSAPAQVVAIMKKPESQATFRELLNKACPDDYQTLKYKEIMEATKFVGEDMILMPDYPTQLRANDSVSKLKGYLDDKAIITGPVNILIVYDEKKGV